VLARDPVEALRRTVREAYRWTRSAAGLAEVDVGATPTRVGLQHHNV
jgi:hypothetical protein